MITIIEKDDNMATLKKSRQRDAILESLRNRYDHPTADMVYESVRKEIPNISLGTVYRNLALLEEQGQIMKLCYSEGPDRFDGNPKPHYHFICNDCGKVLDMPSESMREIQAIAERSFGGKIERHEAYFYGRCEACAGKTIN